MKRLNCTLLMFCVVPVGNIIIEVYRWFLCVVYAYSLFLSLSEDVGILLRDKRVHFCLFYIILGNVICLVFGFWYSSHIPRYYYVPYTKHSFLLLFISWLMILYINTYNTYKLFVFVLEEIISRLFVTFLLLRVLYNK